MDADDPDTMQGLDTVDTVSSPSAVLRSGMPAEILARTQQHLAAIHDDPATPLDGRLLDEFAAYAPTFINDSTNRPVVHHLVSQIAKIIPTLDQSPTPLSSVLLILLRPFKFSDILKVDPPVDFVGGLKTPSADFNTLTLTILELATASASDAAIVAGKADVVAALVYRWLVSPDVEVAEFAGRVLWGLLEVDHKRESPDFDDDGAGQGLMWRRVFGDRDIYGLLFSICSLRPNADWAIEKRQKTLAQVRLMSLIPKVGKMEWDVVAQSQIPEVESLYGLEKGQGLSDFAAMHMVDTKDDVLMHIHLIDFFSNLLKTITVEDVSMSSSLASLTTSQHSSPSLEFLISHNLHAQAAAYYLDPNNPKHDPLDVTYLSGPSAHYLTAYASHYPAHLLATSPDKSTSVERILSRLNDALDISPGKWASGGCSYSDLHMLTKLPRVCLLPQMPRQQNRSSRSMWQSSPLSRLPARPAHEGALLTLGALFHGSEKAEEAAAARALYSLYTAYNPTFFSQLVSYAETIALKDVALASIKVIGSIISARWAPLPSTSSTAAAATGTEERFTLPTEEQLKAMLPPSTEPPQPSGFLAILSPPAMSVLPFLLKPAQTFTNLVGGRGDPESAAYQVGAAKFDTLKMLHERLKGLSQEPEYDAVNKIVEVVARRVSEGAWSVSGGGEVGGRIATMEL
ncbi:MAG: hypothetical protein M1819_004019 [Sarea resinae]|nr:MAG: hypothetical protein M1819_004019 [Sarea resinae]